MTIGIPFYRPYLTGREVASVTAAINGGHWAGDGEFTRACSRLLTKLTGRPSLLTPSGTAALELAIMALGLEPGDQVILPSYTFAATATCLLHAGLRPVLVDIREDTLNLDEALIETAITPRTRAVLPVHYAGVGAEMDAIMETARRHDLRVVEDASQAVWAFYRDRPLGAIGHLGVFSFHGTKNVSSGEGGAVVVNDERYVEAANVHREVGTDRWRFLKKEIPQYGWVDRGSNYLLADLLAAFLLPQLETAEAIIAKREPLYLHYMEALRPLEQAGHVRLPTVPGHCRTNYHFFHLLVDSAEVRDRLREHLTSQGIGSAVHYVPLHRSRGAERFATIATSMKVADMVGDCLIRLPLFTDLTLPEVDAVVRCVDAFFTR